jgi:hypothetical protein
MYEGQSKSSRNFLTSTVWCTISSYCLDRVLPAICTWKFCRECAMYFGGSGATNGRESGFCITITHRATLRSLRNSSSPGKIFLPSPKNHTLRTRRLTFGCSLLRKWASKRQVSQPWRTSIRMGLLNSPRFQKKPSAGACNNGRVNGADVRGRARVCMCACKSLTLKVIR